MFEQEVKTKDGTVRMIRANTEAELAEAVKASKNTEASVGPDITVPGDNAIVSPESLHTEPAYQQPTDPDAQVQEKAELPKEEKPHTEAPKSKK